MVTPRIASLSSLVGSSDLDLPDVPASWAPQVDRVLVVTRPGHFQGRYWTRGELILCDGRPDDGDIAVLAARGVGGTRLGTVHGARVYGDGGELCSPVRWGVAGRVVAVLTPASGRRGGDRVPGVEGEVPDGWRLAWSIADVVEQLPRPVPAAARGVEAARGVAHLRRWRDTLRGRRGATAPRHAREGQLLLFADAAARAA